MLDCKHSENNDDLGGCFILHMTTLVTASIFPNGILVERVKPAQLFLTAG